MAQELNEQLLFRPHSIGDPGPEVFMAMSVLGETERISLVKELIAARIAVNTAKQAFNVKMQDIVGRAGTTPK